MAKTPFLEVKWEEKDIASSCIAVDIEDHDTLIDKATITLLDPHNTMPPFDEGQKLSVTLGWDDEKAMLFSGFLKQPDTSLPSSGSASVTITALDPAWLLNRETRDVAHEDVAKLSDLVDKIFLPYASEIEKGLVICVPNPEFTGEPVIRQHNLTDWQFLQWLGAAYGHRCFVELNDKKMKYYFISNKMLLDGDSQGILQYCHGLNSLKKFSYTRVASKAAKQRIATGVDPKTGKKVESPGVPPERLDPVMVDAQRAAELGCQDPADRARYESGVEAAAEATPLPTVSQRPVGQASHPTLAEAVTINDPTQVLGLRGTGQAVGTILLRAKGKVTIDGIPPWAAGDWYVKKAVHSWRQTMIGKEKSSSYMTDFVVTR